MAIVPDIKATVETRRATGQHVAAKVRPAHGIAEKLVRHIRASGLDWTGPIVRLPHSRPLRSQRQVRHSLWLKGFARRISGPVNLGGLRLILREERQSNALTALVDVVLILDGERHQLLVSLL